MSSNSETKRMKDMPKLSVCPLCSTFECVKESVSSQESSAAKMDSSDSSQLPTKDSIGENLSSVPNEVIYMILKNMSLNDLSNISITNKWFRDFICEYFLHSKTGLPSLLGSNYSAKEAFVGQKEEMTGKQQIRLQVFFQLGLLLKRVTCLYPTEQRINIMIGVFFQLDGIPSISINPMDNQIMRFVFQCYGRLVHHLVSGWDDCELKLVFKRLESISKMEDTIKVMAKNPIGARNSYEYYIRSFYRMICIDPNRPVLSDQKIKSGDDDRLFWLNAILRKHSLPMRARLLLIIFGPLIAQSSPPHSIPYIGYWDLTDTFFIETGLNELGDALRILYFQSNTAEQKSTVISLMEAIMKVPTNWLSENVASLLYWAGDEITFNYLWAKIEMGNYSDAAQKLVYLTLVSHKLDKGTAYVYSLMEGLATQEHRDSLYNEVPIAFNEAVTDIENAIELEDERDVCEVHEMIEANNDLMKNFMLRPTHKSDSHSKSSSKNANVVEMLAQKEE